MPGSVEDVEALRQVDGWPCSHAAVAVVYPDGAVATHGDVDRPLRWASVTKLATAVAALVAVEEGIVDARRARRPARVDAAPPARPRLGAAVRRRTRRSRRPGRGGSTRTRGIEVAAEHVARGGRDAVRRRTSRRVWGFPLAGSPAHGVRLPLDDAARASRASCWRRRGSRPRRSPRRSPCSSRASTASLPGFGRFDPNDWGLGPELRDGKQPALDGHAHLRRARSATSAAAAASSGSTPTPGSRLPRSPTSSSATGRSRPGRGSPTRCS